MIGGLKISSRYAIAATAGMFVGGMFMTSAQAADLGGNCCADLEERVAELEATTVRKGNNKVSVKLSGQVNKAMLFWDDGTQADVYFVDNEASSTRLRVTGDAKMRPGWTAGFHIEWDFHEDNSDAVSRADDDSAFAMQHRISDIWIKSDQLGKLSLGQGDSASNGTSEVDLSGTDVAGYAGVADIGGAFTFIASDGGITAITIAQAHDQFDGLGRTARVRYDTPEMAGFLISASFGEDDQADIALRFKRKLGDIELAAAIAIAESSEGTDFEQTNGSISMMHVPTGLNLTFAAGDRDTTGLTTQDETFWYVKAGLKRKFYDFGATAISFDYFAGEEINVANADYTKYGVQFVQNIDAAAMELYAAWAHHEYDDNSNNYQDIDFFLVGSRIKF